MHPTFERTKTSGNVTEIVSLGKIGTLAYAVAT